MLATPRVSDRLASELTDLGLPTGATVLIHSSMRQVGRLPHGTATLLQAVRKAISPAGTVVVPTQTAHNSITSRIYRNATRGMDAAALSRYEDAIVGFDPATSPSYGMGAFAEYVRQQPGAIRSGHPQASLAAIGPAAAGLMKVHELDSHLGERSPLAALYATGALTLLLGVGYDACTALHLAEYRLPPPLPMKEYRCYVMAEGQRRRREFAAPDLDDSLFDKMGIELDDQPFVRRGQVGRATARIMPVRDTVDFAVGWLTKNRTACPDSNIGINGLPSVKVAPRYH